MKGVDSGKVYARGIAKCSPDDCFNVHIGKAIALRRALGEDVPHEYINAPQPTEVRVGDIIFAERKNRRVVESLAPINICLDVPTCNIDSNMVEIHLERIVDDSQEDD